MCRINKRRGKMRGDRREREEKGGRMNRNKGRRRQQKQKG